MALCANAAEQISTAFGSWGDGCTVEGNTLTFTEAWKGAGVGLLLVMVRQNQRSVQTSLTMIIFG